MFIKKILITLLFVYTSAWSTTLAQLKSMPRSIERDFYIWQFMLQESTNKEQAIEASRLVYNVNRKLESALFKKTALHFRKKRKVLSKEKQKKYQSLISQMHRSGNFFNAWLELNSKEKINLFNFCGTQNRALINRDIGNNLYNQLSKEEGINQFLYRVEREHLTKLANIALKTPPANGNKINYNNLLKMGFDNIKLNRDKIAAKFFINAIYKAKSRFYRDKALFWAYKTSNNSKYLHYLEKSYDINIYKLIALDILNKPYPSPSKAYINKSAHSPINIKNPIAWAQLKQRIFSKKENLYSLAKQYNSPQSAAYYYYILAVASNHKKQFFPVLYKESIGSLPIDRQAMLLALARQESHFIPASISRSFALGMMQFMPFLVRHIAKVRGEQISYNKIFDPKTSILFANTHLNYLYKHLYHPLFVAYAYNAGIGYTRRTLRKNLFKRGKYEPYLSLEMLDNEQANHYGKKVLANYVIYRMLLGSPIRITTLLNQLDKPELTDRFR